MKLESIVPWGRSFLEYAEMFSLREVDLSKNILGCGDGPASFNAELSARGGQVVSIDPIYQFNTTEIQSRIFQVYNKIMPQMVLNADKYTWENISSVEMLGKVRTDAMNIFIADYKEGKQLGRYVDGSLPELKFNDNEFDLALCSHYLFLYSNHVSFEQHVLSIKELCRVAKEVRIYPLLSLSGEISPYLNDVISELKNMYLVPSIVDVKYEFQKGATQMLVVTQTV